jgi:ABC-type lipoprotein export system ATPase subunit
VMVTHEEDIAKHAKRKIYIKDGRVVEWKLIQKNYL